MSVQLWRGLNQKLCTSLQAYIYPTQTCAMKVETFLQRQLCAHILQAGTVAPTTYLCNFTTATLG